MKTFLKSTVLASALILFAAKTTEAQTACVIASAAGAVANAALWSYSLTTAANLILTPLFNDHFYQEKIVSGMDDDDASSRSRFDPTFDLFEDEKEFELSIDLPGVKSEDLTVQLEEDGRIIHIMGERKSRRSEDSVMSMFEKNFAVDESIDTGKIRVDLSDGVLVITAPKVLDYRAIREVPVAVKGGENQTFQEDTAE
mmetsp:Transcript_25957/g.40296  ORF Transcript_25957/g.40296 Transcript_25957/m.40296 type:complete len:199 (+) Transcript_25957:73-669(+)|eukprot:CAMPEP_0196810714 /NCGR_PEP_ID=MMETSP1362-20130617/13256_1 /TAXON_ID=163516 /ORGANISM="Leptocylindrus danicus, Strain CCMP1856" /LENGTH=198 /DNA_ID=CAMNT_0042185831 /DNA_START=50 /DNA_END=646 /DNA_ORIENTATION=-